MLENIKIVPYHDKRPEWCGYRLQLPKEIKIGRGFLVNNLPYY